MQNMFVCLQRISHKLEASLEFTKYPSEPVISILLGKAREHCTAKECCWRTGQYCSPAPEMELVIAVCEVMLVSGRWDAWRNIGNTQRASQEILQPLSNLCTWREECNSIVFVRKHYLAHKHMKQGNLIKPTVFLSDNIHVYLSLMLHRSAHARQLSSVPVVLLSSIVFQSKFLNVLHRKGMQKVKITKYGKTLYK